MEMLRGRCLKGVGLLSDLFTMNKTSRSAAALVTMLLFALGIGFQSTPAESQGSAGLGIIDQEYVETSDGLVWTVYTFDGAVDGTGGNRAAIEGGLTSDLVRLEVSGWPQVIVGERYGILVGGQAHDELEAPTLLRAIPVQTTGGGDQTAGYTPGPARWADGSDLNWQANTASFPTGSGLTDQGLIAAVDAGLGDWMTTAGPVVISSSYGGATPVATNDFDGVNAIYWANTTSTENYLARTYLWFTDPDKDASTPGDALEFDIKFNNDYLWSLGAASGRFDVQSVALHEAGHAVGLGHVDIRANSMFPSLVQGSIKRELGDGDKAGMQALYGTGTTVNQPTTELCKGKLATIVGDASSEVLNGTNGDDVIWAGDGDDTINGRGGNDIICGGNGNDVINGGGGNDKIFAGKGNDQVSGGQGKDVLVGDAGADVLRGGPKRDVLKGGGGNDKLYGEGGRDKLNGQGGSDILDGGKNPDKLIGGGGNDVISTTTGDTGSAGKGRDICTKAGTISACEKRI